MTHRPNCSCQNVRVAASADRLSSLRHGGGESDTGYHTCGGPYSFPGPSAFCRDCAQAGRGGEGQQYGIGAMITAKPRPPLAPGETRTYPVLPLRDIVVFPHMIAALFVGRKK